jgi:hypothetical protein
MSLGRETEMEYSIEVDSNVTRQCTSAVSKVSSEVDTTANQSILAEYDVELLPYHVEMGLIQEERINYPFK